MSIGLAMRNIGRYTQIYDKASTAVDFLQNELLKQTAPAQQGNNAAQQLVANLRQKLAIALALQGLAKEFLDYWKQVVKDFLTMMKSLQELAQGAR